MEEVAERLSEALAKVATNKGAPGPDRQTIAHVVKHWAKVEAKLRQSLIEGSYKPGEIRRSWIPKSPTVSDRIAQMVAKSHLEPIVEPVFHADSYAYRPGKSHLQAAGEARGRCWKYDWVVDLDIKGCFKEDG